jgi:hypothetical protein
VHLKRWKVKGMVWFIALEIHQVIDGRPKWTYLKKIGRSPRKPTIPYELRF